MLSHRLIVCVGVVGVADKEESVAPSWPALLLALLLHAFGGQKGGESTSFVEKSCGNVVLSEKRAPLARWEKKGGELARRGAPDMSKRPTSAVVAGLSVP